MHATSDRLACWDAVEKRERWSRLVVLLARIPSAAEHKIKVQTVASDQTQRSTLNSSQPISEELGRIGGASEAYPAEMRDLIGAVNIVGRRRFANSFLSGWVVWSGWVFG